MRIYDVSVGISPEIPVWPGDAPVRLERTQSMDDGAHANVSRFEAGVHVGTHVDAPLHFIRGGRSVDSIPLKSLIGRAYVVELKRAEVLNASTLEGAGIPPRTRRLLFKTRNSEFWTKGERRFRRDFVAVDPSGAEWMVRKGVRLVGVDYLSVAPFGDSVPTHRILLEAGVVVVEGLNLAAVPKGRYTIYCLPLKLIGSDGAPARVILVGV
ncbi:MAG TPA: cyclase family protein [Anaerolineales bacterium]|nr:cyclase family protein [Anaerolineales bacterium]